MNFKLSLVLLAFVFSACSEDNANQSAPANLSQVYADAVSDSQRTETDKARDAGRNPAAVLEFFAIEPGMNVLDMFSGGGYYTELLARTVGPTGSVVAHTNSVYAQFVGEEATNRYAAGRLPNVEILMAENNELSLPADEFDAVMMVLAYHDIYWVDAENGWPKIDPEKLLAELFRGLKPGGIVAVVDHTAASGSPRETGGSLHRIDPEIVIEEMQAAGFLFAGKSDVLKNNDDDLSLPMSDPAVRGKTDRFVFSFKKPD